MAQFFTALSDELRAFIDAQSLFFTATATADSRINLSPKGMDTFRCFDDRTVAYLDLTGSGNETAAHLGVDGRMTLMFCSFDRKPLILRLYGSGRVVRRGEAEWSATIERFNILPGARQIIVLSISSIQTSCGYAVPRYELIEPRDTLTRWAENRGEAGLAAYWRERNATSIDGLPIDPVQPVSGEADGE